MSVPAPPDGLGGRILALTRALRDAGLAVAVSDGLDAQQAVARIDLAERERLRAALAATLCRAPGERRVFDPLFDAYFPPRPGWGGDEGERDVADLLTDLVDALQRGDDHVVRRLAREAVGTFGRVEGRDGQPAFYSYRVYQQLNPAGVLRRLMGGPPAGETVDERLRRDAYEAGLDVFREEVDADLRRRMAATRGADQLARSLAQPLAEDVDFFRVGRDEEAEMRRAVRPLARRLAARLSVRRRRAREGRLDIRRTLRASLATGGVPAAPVFTSRRRTRPDLVLLCDVSSSVSAFARFTLLLCHALADAFPRVRSFAFVDTLDEVTDLFADADPSTAFARLSTDAKVVWLDGRSDYGNALERFYGHYLDAVTPRSTVLVLGDARNNYRAPNAWVLDEVSRRARALYWLNPEPRAHWGTGDSLAHRYADHVDAMVEVRTLRQLAAFVEQLGLPREYRSGATTAARVGSLH